MKLREFNRETCKQNGDAASASLSLSRKGTITFNRTAVTKLKLAGGDKISFYQDEEEKENWYFEINAADGFALRQPKANSSGLSFSNKQLAKLIAESVNHPGIAGRMLIAGEPTLMSKKTLYGIITVTLKNK